MKMAAQPTAARAQGDLELRARLEEAHDRLGRAELPDGVAQLLDACHAGGEAADAEIHDRDLGFDRIVVSDTDAPNVLVNLV